MSEIVDSEVVNLFAVQAGMNGATIVASDDIIEITWTGVRLSVFYDTKKGDGSLVYELSVA